METYTEAKELIINHNFIKQRQDTLTGLNQAMIEKPLRDSINSLNSQSCFFTLQCCYGHFLYQGQTDPDSLNPLPVNRDIEEVEYRIAYIAFCIDNSPEGITLLNRLAKISTLDRENIQFGSANWFWRRQVNSYVLQVQPERLKYHDKMNLDYQEALGIQNTRDRFYEGIEILVDSLPD